MAFSSYASSWSPRVSAGSAIASILPSVFDPTALFDTVVRRQDLAEASRHYSLNQVDISLGKDHTTPIIFLGSGASYRVFMRKLPQWDHVVAIKQIRSKTSLGISPPDIEEQRYTILREILMLGQFKGHPNIVELLGWGQPGSDSLNNADYMLADYETAYLITEYAPLGDLYSFLLESGRQLSTEQLIKICANVAEGLRSLHLHRIVHGDVKASNILMFEDGPGQFLSKISDLGFAINLDVDDPNTPYRGTYLYNAPEVNDPGSQRLQNMDLLACDIWSFGLLVWTVFKRSDEDIVGCDEASSILNQAIAFANTRESPLETELLRDIFSGCLRIDPSARLSVSTLCEILGSSGPPKLTESFPSSRMRTENSFKPENEYVASLNQTIQTRFGQKKALDVFDWQSLRYSYEVKERIARKLMVAAENHKNPQAFDIAFEASKCFAVAFGVPKDDEAMVRWLHVAAEGGHKYAAALVKRLNSSLTQGESHAKPNSFDYSGQEATTMFLEMHHQQVESSLTIPRDLEGYFNENFGEVELFMQEHDSKGLDLNAMSILHLAAFTGRIPLIDALLKLGANINAVKLDCQSTSLILALYAGQTDAAELLLRRGACVDLPNYYGHSADHFLVYTPPGKINLFVSLFKRAPKTKQATTPRSRQPDFSGAQNYFPPGETPLSLAAMLGHINAVKAFLEEFHHYYTEEQFFHAIECAVMHHQANICDMLLHAAFQVFKSLPNPFAGIGGGSGSSWSVYNLILFHGEHRARALDSTIKVLLAHKFDINGPDPSGLTAMCAAVANYAREPSIAAALLSRGASLHQTSSHGESLCGVLEAAVLAVDESEESGCVQWLLERGVPLKILYTPRPLAVACAHSAYGAARSLLKHPETYVNALDEGMTPLHAACLRDAPKMVQLLLEYGADIFAMAPPGFTPLEVAVLSGNINVVKYYLEKNLPIHNPNVKPSRSILEFYLMIPKMEQTKIMQLLIRHPQLRSSASLNKLGPNGLSPLAMAIVSKKDDLALELLQAGADVGDPHDSKSAWMHLVYDMQRIAFYTLGDVHQASQYHTLLQVFIDQLKSQNFLEARDARGETVLFGAAFSGNVGAVKILLSAGASPHSTMPNGETPLHRVLISAASGGWELGYDWPTSWVGQWDVVKIKTLLSIMDLLLNAGADPNSKSKTGIRPYGCAILAAWRLDSIACVELLHRHGAEPRICGLRLLQLALEPWAFLRLAFSIPSEEEVDMQRLKTVRGLVRICAEAGMLFKSPEQHLDDPAAYALALCECNPVGLKAMLEEGIESTTALSAGQTAFRRAALCMKHGKEKIEQSLSKEHLIEWQSNFRGLSAEPWVAERKIQGRKNLEILKQHLDKHILAKISHELEVLLEEEIFKKLGI